MTTEVRTFEIRDGESARADEARLGDFLASVEVERVDTHYEKDRWRILVLYRDKKRREEEAQIASAIIAALGRWRSEAASQAGRAPEDILPEDAMAEIGRFAPTTPVELKVIETTLRHQFGPHAGAIVGVVRRTLDQLSGGDH